MLVVARDSRVKRNHVDRVCSHNGQVAPANVGGAHVLLERVARLASRQQRRREDGKRRHRTEHLVLLIRLLRQGLAQFLEMARAPQAIHDAFAVHVAKVSSEPRLAVAEVRQPRVAGMHEARVVVDHDQPVAVKRGVGRRHLAAQLRGQRAARSDAVKVHVAGKVKSCGVPHGSENATSMLQ